MIKSQIVDIDPATKNGEEVKHSIPMAIVDVNELIGRTFLLSREDEQSHHACIVGVVKSHKYDIQNHIEHVRFKCSVNNNKYEEILSYSQIMEYLEKDRDNPTLWNFKRIVSCHGPSDKTIKDYNGPCYSACIEWENGETTNEPLAIIEWENGEITNEPLAIIAADNPVTLTHDVDANLYHDALTGQSITGILHMINGTPIDWYSRKQATVETATYGSEFVAAQTCVEQIIDLHTTLQYLGVPINPKSYMLGDNASVVNSSSVSHAKLHKRHNAHSFHCICEAVASKYVSFHFLPGASKPADVLSKHWSYALIWHLLQSLLFWPGDTIDIDSK